MLNRLTLIFCLLIFANSGFTQIIDTIYFDKNWTKTHSKNYKYYRLAKRTGSEIQINDYYKNGNLQYTGTIDKDFDQIYLGFFKNPVGENTYYDKKGRKKYMETTDVEKYLKQIPDIRTDEYENDSLSNLIYKVWYFKNGEVRSRGFLLDCNFHFRWWRYNRKGLLCSIYDCKYDKIDGNVEWYNRGRISASFTYKDGLRHGEFKYYNPFDNILIREGFYENGKKHGELKKYNWSNGYLKKILFFDRGKKVGKTKIKQ